MADPKNYALDRTEKEFLKNETFYGTELVVATFKLCLMNLYLHNIGDLYGKVPVMRGDALLSDPGYRVDYVLTIILTPILMSILSSENAQRFNQSKTYFTLDLLIGWHSALLRVSRP